MPTFFSPAGNPEVWAQKPDGYMTPEEWDKAHPAPEPEPEQAEKEKQLEAYQTELVEKEQWLRDHDYIGVKIATGRATVDAYAAEIATMTEYAARVEELRMLIEGLK